MKETGDNAGGYRRYWRRQGKWERQGIMPEDKEDNEGDRVNERDRG